MWYFKNLEIGVQNITVVKNIYHLPALVDANYQFIAVDVGGGGGGRGEIFMGVCLIKITEGNF
jgi:hypothetical protein